MIAGSRGSLAGLWPVALLSAAIVPVFTHVAQLHRTHWFGGAVGPFWRSFVVPWAASLWAGFVLLALVGWAASAAPPHPRRRSRIARGALGGVLGSGVALLAAVPAVVWLCRLSVAPVAEVVGVFAIDGAAVLIGAALAGALGGALAMAPAAALGGVAGGLMLWWTG